MFDPPRQGVFSFRELSYTLEIMGLYFRKLSISASSIAGRSRASLSRLAVLTRPGAAGEFFISDFCKHQGIFPNGSLQQNTLSRLFIAIIRWFPLSRSGKRSSHELEHSIDAAVVQFQTSQQNPQRLLLLASLTSDPCCLPGPGHALQCTGRQSQGPRRGGSLLQR